MYIIMYTLPKKKLCPLCGIVKICVSLIHHTHKTHIMNAETRQKLAAAFRNKNLVIEPDTDCVNLKYVVKINGRLVAKVYKSFDSKYREIEVIKYPNY